MLFLFTSQGMVSTLILARASLRIPSTTLVIGITSALATLKFLEISFSEILGLYNLTLLLYFVVFLRLIGG